MGPSARARPQRRRRGGGLRTRKASLLMPAVERSKSAGGKSDEGRLGQPFGLRRVREARGGDWEGGWVWWRGDLQLLRAARLDFGSCAETLQAWDQREIRP